MFLFVMEGQLYCLHFKAIHIWIPNTTLTSKLDSKNKFNASVASWQVCMKTCSHK